MFKEEMLITASFEHRDISKWILIINETISDFPFVPSDLCTFILVNCCQTERLNG